MSDNIKAFPLHGIYGGEYTPYEGSAGAIVLYNGQFDITVPHPDNEENIIWPEEMSAQARNILKDIFKPEIYPGNKDYPVGRIGWEAVVDIKKSEVLKVQLLGTHKTVTEETPKPKPNKKEYLKLSNYGIF